MADGFVGEITTTLPAVSNRTERQTDDLIIGRAEIDFDGIAGIFDIRRRRRQVRRFLISGDESCFPFWS